MAEDRAVSCFDPSSMSRTRLERESGDVLAYMGYFNGYVWFQNTNLGAFYLFDNKDPYDNEIATTMLLKASNKVFAFAGFLKSGLDNFKVWEIDDDLASPIPQTHLGKAGFGAAHLYEFDGKIRIIFACGIGKRTIRVFSLQLNTENAYETQELGSLTTSRDVSALGFDADGKKLIAMGEEKLFEFAMPESWPEKPKFTTSNFSLSRASSIFNSQRLFEAFMNRHNAFTNPGERRNDIDKWRTVFPDAFPAPATSEETENDPVHPLTEISAPAASAPINTSPDSDLVTHDDSSDASTVDEVQAPKRLKVEMPKRGKGKQPPMPFGSRPGRTSTSSTTTHTQAEASHLDSMMRQMTSQMTRIERDIDILRREMHVAVEFIKQLGSSFANDNGGAGKPTSQTPSRGPPHTPMLGSIINEAVSSTPYELFLGEDNGSLEETSESNHAISNRPENSFSPF